jgi:hypothetical protein
LPEPLVQRFQERRQATPCRGSRPPRRPGPAAGEDLRSFGEGRQSPARHTPSL